MKELHSIVKGPCLNEKSSRLKEAHGTVVVKVDPRANKIEIGQAVEQLFDVKVAAVRTSMVRGKKKRVGLKSVGRTSDWKKAYITLSEGEIDFLAEL
ncbi:MAG: 50S ribosomal protein L23 [Candidatus Electrothrix sp. AW2]|jgi:large subunit ribosomal protein L23|nr:50S ribosomal protein L23 [Candidatus Electrothrix sp. AX1]MCI5118982.1 50S ribosomal protein L23 [Candidatus Electrothrix gigas]MCI5136803.1 50S ribosomal protein L23 [Candidatus Electrothrix gigas]MCI5180750.1 50S ribosomal protein L23 [Candidatus Electrothrix gigas]MCI5183894.1 50S ribosomal protein L23 [Candidatus Electrothrix gigas]